jgi:hypothetical protein
MDQNDNFSQEDKKLPILKTEREITVEKFNETSSTAALLLNNDIDASKIQWVPREAVSCTP